MNLWKIFSVAIFIFSPQLFAGYDQNVILITVDGVRFRDFFERKFDPLLTNEQGEVFTRFWDKYANQGIVLGDEASGSTMKVSNTSGISFPAYLSIMNGVATEVCQTNYVEPQCIATIETLPEKLLRVKALSRSKVAIFASWDRVAGAVETKPNTVIVNAGPVDFNDENFPGAHDEINRQTHASLHEDGGGERADDLTYRHAMTYLKNNRPKFLWLSLLDSDSHAHWNRYKEYNTALEKYDTWLEEIINTLGQMGEYGKNTTIVLTTDHGRGETIQGWVHHGIYEAYRGYNIRENSFKVWGFVWGPATPGLGKLKNTHYEHINIRPTIETLLGLAPAPGTKVIKEAIK